MLKLINILKTDNFIKADYLPEGGDEIGHIKIDTSSNVMVESKETSFDTPFPTYLSHAKRALEDLAKKESIPTEKLVMWY